MMVETIMFAGKTFLVDKEATKNYRTKFNEPCDCLTCRNYFVAVQKCPEVLQFLETFHIDVCRTEDCMHLETYFETNLLQYIIWYSVCGTATESVTIELCDEVEAKVYPPSEKEYSPNTGQKGEYFWVELYCMLPWTLPDDIGLLKPPVKPTLLEKVRLFLRGKK